MQRFYVVPVEQVNDYRGPKYFAWRFDPDPPGIGCRWSAMDYGFVPFMLVLAHDISEADDAALVQNADTYAFPLDLDQAISPQDNLGDFFETIKLPTNWLTASTSYREFLRILAGMFQFMQRYGGISGGHSLFEEGVSLNTRYRQLSVEQQAWFNATVASFGYDPAIINANSQLRQMLRLAGGAWGDAPFYMGGVEF